MFSAAGNPALTDAKTHPALVSLVCPIGSSVLSSSFPNLKFHLSSKRVALASLCLMAPAEKRDRGGQTCCRDEGGTIGPT